MPLWKIHHPVDAYTPADKKEFAGAITAVYDGEPVHPSGEAPRQPGSRPRHDGRVSPARKPEWGSAWRDACRRR